MLFHRRTDQFGQQRFGQETCFGVICCCGGDWTAIAVDEVHWYLNAQQKFEGFSWHWARHDIAPNDDPIDARAPDLPEYGLKRRKIPVNVVDSCQSPHGHCLR